MPRSEEAAAWFVAVYEAIAQIPYGKVTSYGHIARLLDFRKCRGGHGGEANGTWR